MSKQEMTPEERERYLREHMGEFYPMAAMPVVDLGALQAEERAAEQRLEALQVQAKAKVVSIRTLELSSPNAQKRVADAGRVGRNAVGGLAALVSLVLFAVLTPVVGAIVGAAVTALSALFGRGKARQAEQQKIRTEQATVKGQLRRVRQKIRSTKHALTVIKEKKHLATVQALPVVAEPAPTLAAVASLQGERKGVVADIQLPKRQPLQPRAVNARTSVLCAPRKPALKRRLMGRLFNMRSGVSCGGELRGDENAIAADSFRRELF